MFRTFREGVKLARGRTILLIFLGVSAVYGLSSEGFDRLWTKHLLENFSFPALGDLDPVVWFGIISAATSLLSIAGTEIVKRRADMSSTRGLSRLLFAANGLMVAALALCGLAGGFGLMLAAFLVFQVLRSVTGPLVSTWINPHIDLSVRATVFSMAAQLNAVGQIAGGPPIGLIGTRVSLRAALVADALLLAPVLVLFGRATRPDPVPALQGLDARVLAR